MKKIEFFSLLSVYISALFSVYLFFIHNPEPRPTYGSMAPIELLSVTKNSTASRNTYFLRFTQLEKDPHLFLKVEGEPVKVVNIEEDTQDDTSLATFEVNKSNFSLDLIVFKAVSNDGEKSVNFYLNNGVTGDLHQTGIFMPLIKVWPTGDLDYKPGQNVTFHICFSSVFDISVTISSLDLDNGETFSAQHINPIRVRENRWVHGDPELIHVYSINTSKRSLSGYVEIFATQVTLLTDKNVVQEAIYYQNIVLRPRKQKGAFPLGFIKFKDSSANMTPCFISPKRSCQLNCSLMGNNIESFRAMEILPSGDERILSAVEVPDAVMTVFYFYIDASNEDDQNKVKHFRCEAVGGSSGAVVTYDFHVQYLIIDEFSLQMTTLSNYNNGSL